MSKSAAKPVPILAITPGEPSGVGPDLICELEPELFSSTLLVVTDPSILEQRAKQLGKNLSLNIVGSLDQIIPQTINVLPVTAPAPVTAGTLNPANGAYVQECLEQAVQLCIGNHCSAIVTGPVNKAAINEAGISFSGHTEWLADRTQTKKDVMMLATASL